MGSIGNVKTLDVYIKIAKKSLAALKTSRIGLEVRNYKFNPLCEYILQSEGSQKGYLLSVNTRATARVLKREYQKDKGVKVKIIQYLYSGDRFNGGIIISAREIS